MKNPFYFIRTEKTFDNLPDAMDAKKELEPYFPNLEIGYYIPQPQYKSWVPNWIIRLITKKP